MTDTIEKLVMAEYECAQTLKMTMQNLKDENYKLAMYTQFLYLNACFRVGRFGGGPGADQRGQLIL